MLRMLTHVTQVKHPHKLVVSMCNSDLVWVTNGRMCDAWADKATINRVKSSDAEVG